MSSGTADPFDTAHLRAAVLDAWSASPTRLREDANVENDYALGAYRDRLVVELAQNAADAALAGGVSGRLLLRVDADGLMASNTGAPLDRAGVESLAAMRASNKNTRAVGRFGVGFAAVLAVTNAPEVRSRNGGVRFDRDATLAALPADQRGNAVPTLRLPFPTTTPPTPGYDTAVYLPWRDATSRDISEAAVGEIDDALLLSLTSLDEVVVEVVRPRGEMRYHWQVFRDAGRTVVVQNGQARHWQLTTVGGDSERSNDRRSDDEPIAAQWSATVAVPVTTDGRPIPRALTTAGVVHAPTPTDDPVDLPVLVVADLPLDATRRRVVEGERAREVIDAIVQGYESAVLAAGREHGPDAAAALIPPPQALVGWVDHAIRTGVREKLCQGPLVTRAHDGLPSRVSGTVALENAEPPLVRALAQHVLDLLHPDWYPHLGALRGLGLAVRPLPEVWDILAPLTVQPTEWRAVYEAVSSVDVNALEGLPVPLADGRVVRGARGVVLPDGQAEVLALLGADVVHEDAAHPLLARLGARPANLVDLLERSFVDRVEDAAGHDESEARDMVAAAAGLLADAGVEPGEMPLLGEVLVPVEGGGWEPAASVVLPGSRLDQVAARNAPRLVSDVAGRGWTALGVLGELTPVTLAEQPLDPDVWEGLVADGGAWCLATADRLGTDDPGDVLALEVTVVRGIELVEMWHSALAMLAEPDVRAGLQHGAFVLTADGRRVEVPSPSAWWLGEAPLLDGQCPAEVRLPGDERLSPFFPVVAPPPGLDLELLRALGVRSTLEEWLSTRDGIEEMLEALADPAVEVGTATLIALYAALAEVPDEFDPPERVRALSAGGTAIVAADAAVVAVAPHHALVLLEPHIPGTRHLAELLDLDVSDDERCGATDLGSAGAVRPIPSLVMDAVLPSTYREHDRLLVGDVDVDWWVTDSGEVHAATLEGLARALAWTTGQWARRFELATLLERPVDDRDDRVNRGERYYDV